MLTPDEETQLACSMVLIDLIKSGITDAQRTAELTDLLNELQERVTNIWGSLTDNEKNQALERYQQERNSGTYDTLPPLL